ncbi:NAD(P)-binding protein [Ceratobasidium sp. AG-I]|nr:NAD(P)-binding protein [Ceratobasidium sp. AG-I]
MSLFQPDFSTNKPIIAVCGSTGYQGGSVVRHLLRDGRFAVRALTRKPNGPHARELARAGAVVVEADFDDPVSLRHAFQDCYGAYGMTDYYEAAEKEEQQGINIVEAAKATKLKHLVLCTAPTSPDTTIKVFKAKAIAYAHLKVSGVPYTAFAFGFYFGNIFISGALSKNISGGWQLSFPYPTDIPIPSTSPKDIGAYVLGAFTNPSEWLNKEMQVCNEMVTPRQYAETFAEVTGSTVKINETTREQFMALEHLPNTSVKWGIFKWFLDEHDRGNSTLSTETAARLCPTRQTWREFVVEHTEIPATKPLMIECFCTQELFR